MLGLLIGAASFVTLKYWSYKHANYLSVLRKLLLFATTSQVLLALLKLLDRKESYGNQEEGKDRG